jgi:hypothetical protein
MSGIKWLPLSAWRLDGKQASAKGGSSTSGGRGTNCPGLHFFSKEEAMPAPDPMTDLQNRWYNGLVGGLLADSSVAQLIQPSPLLAQADPSLWFYQNLIPPASLTFNTSTVNSARFFDEYAAVIQALQLPQDQLEQDVGASVFQQWATHLNQIQPPPTADQLPDLFFDWALINAPAVANIGRSDLNLALTFSTARDALKDYVGPNSKPIDFVGGFQDVVSTLQQVGNTQFTFDSSEASDDVSQTWTHGANMSFGGLWTDNSSNSQLSLKFARSKVTVDALFRHTVWISTPGPWYSSFMLNLAFSMNSSPPWPQPGSPTWDEIFGAHGSMQRLIGALLVADSLNVTVRSDAVYSDLDQQAIIENASHGLWPFFVPDEDSLANNVVRFDGAGTMRAEVTSAGGMPIVIGANVLGIPHYLGH